MILSASRLTVGDTYMHNGWISTINTVRRSGPIVIINGNYYIPEGCSVTLLEPDSFSISVPQI